MDSQLDIFATRFGFVALENSSDVSSFVEIYITSKAQGVDVINMPSTMNSWDMRGVLETGP